MKTSSPSPIWCSAAIVGVKPYHYRNSKVIPVGQNTEWHHRHVYGLIARMKFPVGNLRHDPNRATDFRVDPNKDAGHTALPYVVEYVLRGDETKASPYCGAADVTFRRATEKTRIPRNSISRWPSGRQRRPRIFLPSPERQAFMPQVMLPTHGAPTHECTVLSTPIRERNDIAQIGAGRSGECMIALVVLHDSHAAEYFVQLHFEFLSTVDTISKVHRPCAREYPTAAGRSAWVAEPPERRKCTLGTSPGAACVVSRLLARVSVRLPDCAFWVYSSV